MFALFVLVFSSVSVIIIIGFIINFFIGKPVLPTKCPVCRTRDYKWSLRKRVASDGYYFEHKCGKYTKDL